MTDETLARTEEPLPSFDAYVSGGALISRVTAINKFSFVVTYQNDHGTPDQHLIDTLAAEGLAILDDVLRDSGIYQLQHLDVETQAPSKPDRFQPTKPLVTFTYEHDKLHSQFAIFRDRFTITRKDSTLESFYNWYTLIMPHAARIESTIRQVIAREWQRTVEAVSSSIDFTVNFGEFMTRENVNGSREGRNVDVLSTLIPMLPDAGGREMRQISTQEFIRLDLTLSRIERFGAQRVRNVWYFIEAPFNENGKYIVLRGQLRNASTELPSSNASKPTEIIQYDPDLTDDYRIALIDFFRDRVMEGFAQKIFGSWDFETPRQF